MNGKLLTQAQKTANRLGRNRRNAQRQARRRRLELIRTIALTAEVVGGVDAINITGAESLELLTSHILRVRSIAARIGRASRLAGAAHVSAASSHRVLKVPRPIRILEGGRRAQVFPWLVEEQVSFPGEATVLDTITAATKRSGTISPHALLDYFVGSSGLPWSVAADVLCERGLVPAAFDPVDIHAIRSAREFWNRYATYRSAYQASVEAGEVSSASGDWSLIEYRQVAELLPGVKLPRAFKRQAYLGNLIRSPGSLCLDLHSFPSLRPLICHPFRALKLRQSGFASAWGRPLDKPRSSHSNP